MLVIFIEANIIFQLFEHYELVKLSLILFILKYSAEVIYSCDIVMNKIGEGRSSTIIT